MVGTATPIGLTMTIPDNGRIIDSTTGQAKGAWAQTVANRNIPGTVSGGYSAPCGAVVNWLTGFYAGGRQLKGKTFLVPLSGQAYQEDGSLKETYRSALQDATESLISNSSFGIYAPTTRSFAEVSSAVVSDAVAVLRSRRD